jgi:perosamine synthetase
MIKLFKPTIKRKDMDLVLSTLVDEQLGPGLMNHELSRLLCADLEAIEAIAVRTYPRALAIALRTLQLKEGDHVVISPLSPACYIWLLQEMQLEVVFADVDPRTGCMLAEPIKMMTDPVPDAILMHEPLGNLPDHEAFSELSIPIVEDLSQSLHSEKDHRRAGTLGQVLVVSFEEDSMLATGGGAAVLVKNKKHAAFMHSSTQRNLSYDLLPDINCALVINQLKVMDHMIEKREEYFKACQQAIMKTKHQLINEHNDVVHHNGYAFCVLLDSRVQDIIRYVKKYKIETAMPFEQCAITILPERRTDFPNSIPFVLRAMIFPLYPLLSKDQLMTLVRVLSTLP